MSHFKSGIGHLAPKFQKIRNVMDKPDPYMAWKDERSLLTQETKKKKGVIKTSDLGTKKKEGWNEVSVERANEAKRLTVLNWTKGIINARKNN